MAEGSEMEVVTAGPSLPPGGLFEIVFSFDTTGSMSSVIDEVKGRLQEMIQRLQSDIPGMRTGVIAHGDYCDKDVYYLEKHIDLTTDVRQLCDFVSNVDGTGGGDPEECYELILKMASQFSWTPGSQRALVVIGDSVPHEPDYDMNTDNLDWRKEAEGLFDMGIKIYGVQAFENDDSTAFFTELTEKTNGQHLKLGDFSHICDFIMAICYREKGEDFLEGYEAEVRAREARKALHKDLEGMFGVLRRGDSSASKTGSLQKSNSAISVPSVPRKISSLSSVSATSSGSAVPTAVVVPVKRTPVMAAKKKQPAKRTSKPKQAKTKAKTAISKKAAIKSEPLKKRHLVSDAKFTLTQKTLYRRWSPWKLAITTEEPKSRDNWTNIKDNKICRKVISSDDAWCRKVLFTPEPRDQRVLYEVAVQTRPKCRKCVLFYRWSRSSVKPSNWLKTLFGKLHLAKQVEEVLKENCKIFVRRFSADRLGKNQQKSVKNFSKMYDYAWSGHHGGDQHLHVRRNKILISAKDLKL